MASDDLTFRCGSHRVIEHRMTNRGGVNVIGIQRLRGAGVTGRQEAEGGKRKAGGRHRGYRIWDMGLGKAESGKRKAEKSEGRWKMGHQERSDVEASRPLRQRPILSTSERSRTASSENSGYTSSTA